MSEFFADNLEKLGNKLEKMHSCKRRLIKLVNQRMTGIESEIERLENTIALYSKRSGLGPGALA